jgi:hypothetical protein
LLTMIETSKDILVTGYCLFHLRAAIRIRSNVE